MNIIVSIVKGFKASEKANQVGKLNVENNIVIELEDKREIYLDPGNPRSANYLEILKKINREQIPVSIELDQETQAIKQLFIPHVTRVIELQLVEEDVLEVELEFSHARHLLRLNSTDDQGFENLLRKAKNDALYVIVTEDDSHNIIDVRLFAPSDDGYEVPSRPFPVIKPRIRLTPLYWLKDIVYTIVCWCWWPWWWLRCRCISEQRAKQVFDAMRATSCDPSTVPAPCIPFLYPDDGCWGRAHEMCRLMINMGLSPKKVWIQGSLQVSAVNNPNCQVLWGWHVAPTLCVHHCFFFSKAMVIDPSLFDAPVTKAEWKSVQGDSTASLIDSPASVFYLWGNITDPSYAQTNTVLNTYRLQLQNRTIQHGPPPYLNCV